MPLSEHLNLSDLALYNTINHHVKPKVKVLQHFKVYQVKDTDA